MTEKELAILQISLLIDYHSIEADDLFDIPEADDDILLGDDFEAFRVSNPSTSVSNAVFLSRPLTHKDGAGSLPSMKGWIQVDKGFNPNDYNYKIIARLK